MPRVIVFSIFLIAGIMTACRLDAQPLYQQWNKKFGPKEPIVGGNNILYTGNLVVDNEGSSYTYVQDNFVSSLIKFNNQGDVVWRNDYLTYPDFPSGTWAKGLYYANDALYYLSQAGITKFGINGNVMWRWNCPTLLNTTLLDPIVAFDNRGNLFVTWQVGAYTQSIAKVSQNGSTDWSHSYSFTSNGDTSLDEWFALACDSIGNAYLEFTTTASPNNITYIANLIKYDSLGNTIWASDAMSDPGGIDFALDPRNNGDLYATTYEGFAFTDKIYLFDAIGNLKSTTPTTYFFSPLHVNGPYHYYWSSVNSAILKTDSSLNILDVYRIPNCEIGSAVWSNGSIYGMGVSTTSSNQAVVVHLNRDCQLIQTLLPTYSHPLDPIPTGGADASGNFYLLSSDWGDSAELYKFCSKCAPNINGYVYADTNKNCVWDYNESAIESRVLTITPGPYYAVSDIDGSFGLILPQGTYTMWANVPQYWNTTCADTVSFTIDSLHSENGILFGSYADSGIVDVALQISAGEAVPGSNQNITVDYSNIGTITDSGWVQVNIDSLFMFTQAIPTPDSISGNSLFWKYNNLQPGQWSEIDILDSVPTYLWAYYVYQVSASITPILNDENPTNNIDTFANWVLSSFDPNEKSCKVKNATADGYLTDSSILVYTIAFQNTGNDTAHKIVVADTLSSNLDISTFTLLQTTFKNYQITLLPQNILRTTFENIDLPDSQENLALSQAFIKYSIMPLPNLQPGTVVTNSATIYFDFNPGVSTNTTVNYYEQLPLGVINIEAHEQLVYAYPNPLNTEAKIKISNPTYKPTQVTIYDVTGRVVQSQRFENDEDMIIERNLMSSGMYLLEISQQNARIGVARIVVE